MASTPIDGGTLEEPDSPPNTTKFLPPPATCALLQLQCIGSGVSAMLNGEAASSLRVVESSPKLLSPQYKGAPPQQNGCREVQIYEKDQRILLSNNDSQLEAAHAYNIAANKFRGQDAVSNFGSPEDCAELYFPAPHSKTEIADMLRQNKSSCELKLYRAPGWVHGGVDECNGSRGSPENKELLFEKTVTRSDVGKANRLVIPNQYAQNHLRLKETVRDFLTFKDERGKVWRFRCSYWNWSRKYVLTKGWFKFVKEKALKPGDVVIFKRGVIGGAEQLYIERKRGDSDESNGSQESKELLFEKTVTPSDVGKLKRLVIPNHCARNHLRLKKVSEHLTFEDECGKVWRFWCSYGKRNRNYVLSKGWFKFVKEKELKAGDVVIFKRGVIGGAEQLYIERKRRDSDERPAAENAMIRLFGEDISEAPPVKMKELELFPVLGGSLKTHCVGDSK